MKSFVITPYQAAGPIRFGMSPEQVTGMLGPAHKVGQNKLGEKDFRYSNFSIRISEQHGVVEVGFLPTAEVTVDGISVFSEPSAFSELLGRDGDPLNIYGFIVLLRIGITLTGFHDHDDSQKSVTAFCRGRWDTMLPQATKFAI